MTNYKEERVKLANYQLNNFKYATKNQTAYKNNCVNINTKKKFEAEELPNELFLTARQIFIMKKCVC